MEDNNSIPVQEQKPKRGKAGLVGGLVLIVLGLIFLLENYVPELDFGRLWPIVLIVIGFGVLWDNFRR